MQQKASVGWFDVHFGLDLCRFVNELCAKERKHSIILNLHSELNRRVAVVKSLEKFINRSSIWYNSLCVIHLSPIIFGQLAFALKGFFHMLHIKTFAIKGPSGEPIATPYLSARRIDRWTEKIGPSLYLLGDQPGLAYWGRGRALYGTNHSWKLYRQEYVLSLPVVHWNGRTESATSAGRIRRTCDSISFSFCRRGW